MLSDKYPLPNPETVISREQFNNFFEDSYTPSGLISLLSDPLGEIYSADAGIREGYTIGEHTELVLKQFDRYFSDRDLPGGIDAGFVRLLIGLHDIGKPMAIAAGDKHSQHKYNADLAASFLELAGYDESEVNIARALLGVDILGDYIKSSSADVNNTKSIADRMKAISSATNLAPMEFLELSIIMHISDASSYTEDAGGRFAYDDRPSLAFLFEFEQEEVGVRYSAEVEEKILLLKEAVLEDE